MVTGQTLVNNGNWNHYSITVGSGHIALVQFFNNTPNQAQFRNLTLVTASVPEPETLAMWLFGMALAGVAARRRRS